MPRALPLPLSLWGPRIMHPLSRALVLAASAHLVSCTGALVPQERVVLDPLALPTLVTAPFGDLIEQWVDLPGSLYVRRPRPDLGAYRAVRLERPAVFYRRSLALPLQSSHAMLVRALDGVVREQIAVSISLPETREAGTGVLRVSSEVVNLDFDRARAANSRVTSIIEPGAAATFVLQLTDDATGTPLVRIATRRPMPGGIYTGPWAPDIDRSIQLFHAFAKDARRALAHVVRQVQAPE